MSIIDDEHELNRILESTNLDGYELIHLPMEQIGDWWHEHTDVGMASTLGTGSTSVLARREGNSTDLRSGVDPCQGCSLSSPPYHYNFFLQINVADDNEEGNKMNDDE